MKPRDTRADASGLPPHAPLAPRQMPPLVLPAAMRAETACYPSAHAPQFQLTADFALSRLTPAG